MQYVIVDGERFTLAQFVAMDKSAATWVDASGCTGLTTLDLPAATRVYASGCTGLTTLDLPAATWVYASGCTGLTTLDLPAATTVDVGGCTGGPAICHAGKDSRGYSFDGLRTVQGLWVAAGCRYFDLATARAHWGVGGPSDRADCRALVETIAAWGQS